MIFYFLQQRAIFVILMKIRATLFLVAQDLTLLKHPLADLFSIGLRFVEQKREKRAFFSIFYETFLLISLVYST